MGAYSKIVVAVVAAGVSTVLHGCGGGDAPTPSPTPNSPTPSPPTPAPIAPTPAPTAPRTPPLTEAEAVKYLNEQYLSFDEKDDQSKLGVFIYMASKPDSFYNNIFCSPIPNPIQGTTKCYKGGADCRLSTSLYSHKWLYNKTTKTPMVGFGRPVGFIFNETMVETRWAKCAYIWDGASDNKYNRGCGDGAPGADCKVKGTAWDNICPSTKKTCTGDSLEVTRALCKKYGGVHPVPPTHDAQPACLYPAVALDYHGQVSADQWTGGSTTSKLREMAKDRILYNDGSDATGPNVEKWNEIVLDEQLVLSDILLDPAAAVPAFLYAKSLAPDSRKHAMDARDEFCKANKVVGSIPVVMANDMNPKDGKPFEVDTGYETSEAVV